MNRNPAGDSIGPSQTPRHQLETFFDPKGIAVVGARRKPGFGFGIPVMLKKQGFGDRMFLVSPSGGKLHAMPVYEKVTDVPGPVDLAIVIVPAAVVPEVLAEIGERGIRHVIVESAGFAEAGAEGRALQDRARAVAREHGLRVIGPNCVGVVNTQNRFTSVEVIDEALEPGNTAIIAQSGVFGNVLLDGLYQRGLFVSKAITLGNRMDVDECDLLDYLENDPQTRAIMMYLEGAADGRRLKDTLLRVTRKKPVLILKSGRTEQGRQATSSHTGSLSGEDMLYDAIFAQTGAVRAGSLEELVNTAVVFSSQPLPKGGRLGIVTASGSLGALATDAAINAGLEVPPVPEAVEAALQKAAPGWMNVRNPLDVGPSGLFDKAVDAMLNDPGVDMLIAIAVIPFAVIRQLKPVGLTTKHFFGDLAAIRDQAPEKPFVLCVVGNREFVDDMAEAAGPKIAVLTSPELSARAMAALKRYAEYLGRLK